MTGPACAPPRVDGLRPSGGHGACAGCAGAVALKLVLKALGPDATLVLPPSCWSVVAGDDSEGCGVPTLHAPAGTGIPLASGIRAALDAAGRTDAPVLVWCGDEEAGASLFDELATASATRARIVVGSFDTGSLGTLPPTGLDAGLTGRADLVVRASGLRLPYAASASVSEPADLDRKVRRAASAAGPALLSVLSPCPPGWGCAPDESIALARGAVASRIFPVFEVEDGHRWHITVEHAGTPVGDWLRRQGRFRNLSEHDVHQVQQAVNERWRLLLARTGHAA